MRVAGLMAIIAFLSATHAAAHETGPSHVRCGKASAILRNGAFTLQIGSLRLRKGTGCVKDDLGRCDWTVELTRSERWAAAPGFLLAVVHSNHQAGSGAWDSVFMWRCRDGDATAVFTERYLYGARIDLGKDRDFRITSGVWLASDPTCCPSEEMTEHYVWNEPRGRFMLVVDAERPRRE